MAVPRDERASNEGWRESGDSAERRALERIAALEGEGFDARAWLDARMRATPWWALSLAFHAVLLGSLTLVGLAHTTFKVEPPAIVFVGGKRPARVDTTNAVRDLVDRAAPPLPDAVDEETVIIEGAILGDHLETDDGKKTRGIEVDVASDDTIISRMPGFEPGIGRLKDGAISLVSPPIGVGQGSGASGRRGTPGPGGGVNMIRQRGMIRGGGPKESAILAGLRWLARHQGADGGWHASTFAHGCAAGTACAGEGYAQFDAGLTGLSLLAFLGAGYTQTSRESYEDPVTHARLSFGDVVKRAAEFLAGAQDAEGCFGPRTGEFLYNHGIAALAMAEMYGQTLLPRYREPAQRGIDFLTAAQNPYRGWRYTVKPGDNDTSVTGWAVMALKSAAISGLTVPGTSFDGARAWLDSVTDEDGEVGYSGKGKVDVVVKGKNEAWRAHPSMTAVGLVSRIFMDPRARDARYERQARRLTDDLPRWETPAQDRPIDMYYWYYGTLALYQLEGEGTSRWGAWDGAIREALLPTQALAKDGCASGSWDPTVDRWGYAGGRVYATAINVLTLEVVNRYGRVFGGTKGG